MPFDILITSEDSSRSLVHHGVKGMKWGVRHDKERKAKAKAKAKDIRRKYRNERWDASVQERHKADMKAWSTPEFKALDAFEKKYKITTEGTSRLSKEQKKRHQQLYDADMKAS